MTEEDIKILNAWRTPRVGLKKFWNLPELYIDAPVRQETRKEYQLLSSLECFLWTYRTYPSYLQNKDVPPCFWYKGNPTLFEKGPMVGIIGSRSIPSVLVDRVKNRLYLLLSSLSQETICSGLARGCDTLAHEQRLDSVAFLPCSIDKVYPYSNRELKEELSLTGLCISPWSPYSVPLVETWRLLGRTDFLLHCCKEIYVLYAHLGSGSEYTIAKALKQGLPVTLFTYEKEDHPLKRKYPQITLIKDV